MNQDGRDLCLFACFAKQEDVFTRQRLRHPAARVAREKLNGIAAGVLSDNESIMDTTLDWCMEADLWSSISHGLMLIFYGLIHYAQHVSAEDLVDVGFSIAAAQELLG